MRKKRGVGALTVEKNILEKIKEKVNVLFEVTLEKDFSGEKLLVYFFDEIVYSFDLKKDSEEYIIKKINKFIKEIEEAEKDS